jgi:DNA-binding SARP family transcriptional activator/tetratricopeptide (TPR) repeat protein
MPQLRVSLLGTPRIERDERPVSLERQKAIALLAYLATTDVPHGRDRLATLLWPHGDAVQARASLRRVLATLTRALPGPWWQADRASIALLEDPELWIDVREYRRMSRATHSADGPEDGADHARLISLYGEGFLAGFTLKDSPEFDEWQYLQAEELQGIAVAALERQVLILHEVGSLGAAMAYARQWLSLDLLNEACHASIMRLHLAAGNRSAALRQYHECARLLDRELGVAPQPATSALYHRICNGAGADDRVWAGSGGVEASSRPAPGIPRERFSEPAFSTRLPGLPRLVGREREMAIAAEAIAGAPSRAQRSLLIRGEPGIGKTRLACEAVGAAESAGITVLRAECSPEGATPYSAITQFIRHVLHGSRELALGLPDHVLDDVLVLAPELRVSYPDVRANPTLEPGAEQRRMFDSFRALCDRLASERQVVLFVDDLHWIDPASQSMLRHLLKGAQNERVSLVATLRDAEASSNEALDRWLGELERDGQATQMKLGPLSREQAREHLRAMLRTEADTSDEFLEAIYHRTAGNPFFLEETCRSMLERGDLYFAGGYWRRKDLNRIDLPKGVRAAIMARVQRLPEPARALLHTAAVLGQQFSLGVLQQVTSSSEPVLGEALEQVQRMDFLRLQPDSAPATLVFAHPLIPFAIREEMGALRLQRLHANVASALEASSRSTDPETLARHSLAAGDAARGLKYSLASAERAASVYAYEAAIDHLHRALGLLGQPGDAPVKRATLERLADLHGLVGEQGTAIEMLHVALTETSQLTTDPSGTLRLHRKIIEAHRAIRERSENVRFTERVTASIAAGLGLVEVQQGGDEAALFLAALAKDPWGARADHDWAVAEQFARRAVAAAEELGSPAVLSRALSALGVTLGAQQRLGEQAEVATRRLAISRSSSFTDHLERLDVLCESGAVFLRVGEYGRSLSLLLEAERLAGSMRAIDAHVYAVGMQAECLFYLDRWQEMLEIEEKVEALRLQYTPGRVGRFCFYCGLAANVLALQGRFEEAGRRREEAHEIMRASMGAVETWPRGGLYCRGKALVGLGEYDLVRGELERALQEPASWVGDHDLYATLADIASRQRRDDDLRRFAPLAEETAASVGHALYGAIADRAWGVLHTIRAESAEAERRLLDALSVFRTYDAKWQMGTTLVALGDLALTRGAAEIATQHYSEALRLFDLMGARPDGDDVRARLEPLLDPAPPSAATTP